MANNGTAEAVTENRKNQSAGSSRRDEHMILLADDRGGKSGEKIKCEIITGRGSLHNRNARWQVELSHRISARKNPAEEKRERNFFFGDFGKTKGKAMKVSELN
jgi:hypothetical protein